MKPRHLLCNFVALGLVASVSFMLSSLFPFQSEGNYAFVNTADSMVRRQMKKIPAALLKPALGGKSSTF